MPRCTIDPGVSIEVLVILDEGAQLDAELDPGPGYGMMLPAARRPAPMICRGLR